LQPKEREAELAAAVDTAVKVLAPANRARAVDLGPAMARDLEGRVAVAAMVRAEALAPEEAGQDSADLGAEVAAAEDTDLAAMRRVTTSMAGMDLAAPEWVVAPEWDRVHGM
jgi:hypothetical protein